MSEMLGLNEDVVFSFLFCQSPPESDFLLKSGGQG